MLNELNVAIRMPNLEFLNNNVLKNVIFFKSLFTQLIITESLEEV